MNTPADHHRAVRSTRWTLFELLALGSSILLILSPLAVLAFALLSPTTTAAQTGVDLRVSKAATSLTGADLASIAAGQEFYYEIHVQTSSTATVNATLTDSFPSAVQALNITDHTGGDCTLAGSQLTCSLAITAQREGSVLVRSRASPSAASGSRITNTVTVTAGTTSARGSVTLAVGGGSPPSPTPIPPSSTPIPPTATPIPPSATPIPPTATPIPPSATPIPPSPTVAGTPTAPPPPPSNASPTATSTATVTPPAVNSTPLPVETSAAASTTTNEATATAAGTVALVDTSTAQEKAQRTAAAATATSGAAKPPAATSIPRAAPAPAAGGRSPAQPTQVPGTGQSKAQPTRAATTGAAGGTRPPADKAKELGNKLPATSGGYPLWLAPLLGLGLLLHTIRVRRARMRI